MILKDVMEELGTALEAINGLRVYPFPAENVQIPAAVVSYPESIDYDTTMGNGMQKMRLNVIVAMSRVTDRVTPAAASNYTAPSGAESVKEKIEDHTAASWSAVQVIACQFEPYTIASVDYLAAVFTLEIFGPSS